MSMLEGLEKFVAKEQKQEYLERLEMHWVGEA